jgi:hypothetical protein
MMTVLPEADPRDEEEEEEEEYKRFALSDKAMPQIRQDNIQTFISSEGMRKESVEEQS